MDSLSSCRACGHEKRDVCAAQYQRQDSGHYRTGQQGRRFYRIRCYHGRGFGEVAAIALRNSRTLDELDETNRKLEHFNEALVNREMRIVEVKQEVNSLCRELGRDPVYRVGTGD